MAANNSGRGSGSSNERGQRETSRKGGESSGNSKGNSQRGLASADKETRERVAREGGKASSGGGRKGNQGGS